MTYNEIHKVIFSPKDPWKTPLKLSEAEAKAWAIIRTLNERGGFDDWWGNIDHETQDEIFDYLIEVIAEK